MLQRKTKGRVIAFYNPKGGSGKTTACANLGVGLTRVGEKVLLIDADPQENLTIAMGWNCLEKPELTFEMPIDRVVRESFIDPGLQVLHHSEDVDLLPAHVLFPEMDIPIILTYNFEPILRKNIEYFKNRYDYILIDCPSALEVLKINILTVADSIIIPVQPEYLSLRGLERSIDNFINVQKKLNPHLNIEGILINMIKERTLIARRTVATMQKAYGKDLKIFTSRIPYSVRVNEMTAKGKSIFANASSNKVALGYATLAGEILSLECRNEIV